MFGLGVDDFKDFVAFDFFFCFVDVLDSEFVFVFAFCEFPGDP